MIVKTVMNYKIGVPHICGGSVPQSPPNVYGNCKYREPPVSNLTCPLTDFETYPNSYKYIHL